MGFEINKKNLSGSALNAVNSSLEVADKDKNGLSSEEVSVFAEELKKYKDAGWINKKEYKQVIGSLNITEGEAATAEPTKKETRKAKKETAQELARNTGNALRHLNEITSEGVSRDNIINEFDKEVRANKDEKNYVEFKALVQSVINESKKYEYVTFDDIDKNAKNIKKTLKSQDIDNKLLDEIIENVNASIKTELVTTAYAEIINAHNNAVNTISKDAKNNNLEVLTRTVLTQLIAFGKIDKENVVEQSNGTYKIEGDDVYADAYNRYVSNVIKQKAGDIWLDSLVDQKDLKAGKVKRGTINDLKENNNYDAYVKGYANSKYGDDISGYEKVKNIDSEIKARFNNVKALSIQTKDEILNVLGKESTVFDSLMEATAKEGENEIKLVVKNEDGSYDISKLQLELLKQIGADAKVNRHADIDEAIGEIKAALSKSQEITNLNSLTEKELKDILKLCGFPVEKNVHFGEVMKGLLNGALLGAASGVGAFALTPISVDPTPLDINVDVNLISGSKLSGATLPDELIGSVIETETGINVNIKGLIGGVSGLATLLKYIGPIAYKSALIGGAIGLLGGLTGNSKGEIPITRLRDGEKEDYPAYVERVRRENPEYAEVFETLAGLFVREDKSWDREGYENFLNNIAGEGGKLNRDELRGKLIKLKMRNEETTRIQKLDPVSPIQIASIKSDKLNFDRTINRTYIHYRKGGDSWAGLVEAYYPDLVKACNDKMGGKDGAIRALKTALATDENGNVDAAKLQSLLTATDLPKEIKLPSKIKGCIRVINDVKAVKIDNDGKGEYVAPLEKVGRDEIDSIKLAGPTTYIARDFRGFTASASTKEAALEALKKTSGVKEYANEEELLK